MHYYPHHISDFNNATRHLTRLERGIYRDLLDLYYDTEKPLTLDLAYLSRRVLAISDEECAAVKQVLSEFFQQTADGYRNGRCDDEIAAYRRNVDQKSRAGKASAAKRAGLPSGEQQSLIDGGADDAAAGKQKGKGAQRTRTKNQNQEPEEKPLSGPHMLVAFADFWSAYPRKVGKTAAEKSFKKYKFTQSMIDRVMDAIEKQKHGHAWMVDDGEFIPHPATWLNQGRWDDEVQPYKPRPKNHGAWWASPAAIQAKAAELGITPNAGETESALKIRISQAIDGKLPAAPVRNACDDVERLKLGGAGTKPANVDLKAIAADMKKQHVNRKNGGAS